MADEVDRILGIPLTICADVRPAVTRVAARGRVALTLINSATLQEIEDLARSVVVAAEGSRRRRDKAFGWVLPLQRRQVPIRTPAKEARHEHDGWCPAFAFTHGLPPSAVLNPLPNKKCREGFSSFRRGDIDRTERLGRTDLLLCLLLGPTHTALRAGQNLLYWLAGVCGMNAKKRRRSSTSQLVGSRIVACPCCGKGVHVALINDHLETCGGSGDDNYWSAVPRMSADCAPPQPHAPSRSSSGPYSNTRSYSAGRQTLLPVRLFSAGWLLTTAAHLLLWLDVRALLPVDMQLDHWHLSRRKSNFFTSLSNLLKALAWQGSFGQRCVVTDFAHTYSPTARLLARRRTA